MVASHSCVEVKKKTGCVVQSVNVITCKCEALTGQW